jgi:hypothetical protein
MSTANMPAATAPTEAPRLREVTIAVRVTAEEKAKILARADARGLAASTYLRALGLGLLPEG